MKISQIAKSRVIPLSVHEDIYIKDLPAKEYEAMFKVFSDGEQDEDKTKEFLVTIFNDMICDKDGNPFEDLAGKSYEEIVEVLPIGLMWEIVHDIPNVIVPGQKTLGN